MTGFKLSFAVLIACVFALGDSPAVAAENVPRSEETASRHRAEWMHQGTFGLMVHYIIKPQGHTDEERKKDFPRIVNAFDVDAFMKQFDATGADWLIFTLGQNTGYYCSPNSFLDKELPGHTSKRDLVLEIARAIKARKKHFIAYIPAEVRQQSASIRKAFSWNEADLSAYQQRYGEFIRQYSLAYGTHIDGWWFDGGWIQPKRFGDWKAWMAVCRAGNPNAAVAISPGPSQKPMTRLQDFLAGETYQLPPPHMPTSRFVDGVQWHALLPLDCTFTGGQPHSYADEVLFDWVLKCKKAGGAVTMNLPFDQKAVIPEKSVRQLGRLAAEINRATRVSKTLKIKVPEKVDAVYWSTQIDLCSVQFGLLPSVPNGSKKPAFPRTQVWLLKSDGNVIPYSDKPRTIGISNAGYNKYSILFRFPHSAKTEAVPLISMKERFLSDRSGSPISLGSCHPFSQQENHDDVVPWNRPTCPPADDFAPR